MTATTRRGCESSGREPSSIHDAFVCSDREGLRRARVIFPSTPSFLWRPRARRHGEARHGVTPEHFRPRTLPVAAQWQPHSSVNSSQSFLMLLARVASGTSTTGSVLVVVGRRLEDSGIVRLLGLATPLSRKAKRQCPRASPKTTAAKTSREKLIASSISM